MLIVLRLEPFTDRFRKFIRDDDNPSIVSMLAI